MEESKREKALIGARLRSARLSAQVSKEEAAAAAGAQISAVDAWERGSCLPTLTQFRGLLTCYGELAHRILFGSHPLSMSTAEVRELALAAKSFSPGLRAKMELMVSLLARSSTGEMTHH